MIHKKTEKKVWPKLYISIILRYKKKTNKYHNNETVAKYINLRFVLHHFRLQN